jgi:DNA repair protein RadA/Sms
MAKKAKTQFECQHCGYISPRYLGKCPQCGSWNSMVEEKIQDTSDRRTRTTLTGQKNATDEISGCYSQKRTSCANAIR